MREYHQLQTPQRDHISANRRLKSTPDVKGNLRQVAKKSLNPEFTAVLEEDSAKLKSPKNVSDHSPFSESAENFIAWENPVDISSSETIAISDLTSPASTIASENHHKCEAHEVDSYKEIESVEVEMLVRRLKEVRMNVLKSKGLGHSSKLLDALINVIIEEVDDVVYEEKEWIDKLLSREANMVLLLTFMLGILVIFVVWFFDFGANDTSTGLRPT